MSSGVRKWNQRKSKRGCSEKDNISLTAGCINNALVHQSTFVIMLYFIFWIFNCRTMTSHVLFLSKSKYILCVYIPINYTTAVRQRLTFFNHSFMHYNYLDKEMLKIPYIAPFMESVWTLQPFSCTGHEPTYPLLYTEEAGSSEHGQSDSYPAQVLLAVWTLAPHK